ncbi:hypothetical protein F5B18DRAFT_440842 [Nemania serpens]|nr:hypothetical protein F5B18DRAFT_440842 [Nemania serpens]
MRLPHASPALLAVLTLTLTTAPILTSAASTTPPKDAILLSTVQSLTLRAGRSTAHRRVPSIPQLRCVSSPRVCALHAVDVMRCANSGSSYSAEDVEWSCVAALPPELKLGATDVLCEGYARPDDPYVLRGSCGVEYRLVLTDLGERRFPDIANAGSGGWFSGWGGGGGSGGGSGESGKPLRSPDPDGQGSDWGAWLFGILIVGVLLWIVYSAWTQAGARGAVQRRPRNNNGWFGGGGGGFDPGFGPGGGGGGGYGGHGGDPPPPYSKYSSSQTGWRPGFWSGVAGGAGAAYLAGNRRDRQQESRNFYGGGSSSSGSWGSRPGPSSDSGAGSISSSRYSSTGFGSTSRR